jgi:hypothetical protein
MLCVLCLAWAKLRCGLGVAWRPAWKACGDFLLLTCYGFALAMLRSLFGEAPICLIDSAWLVSCSWPFVGRSAAQWCGLAPADAWIRCTIIAATCCGCFLCLLVANGYGLLRLDRMTKLVPDHENCRKRIAMVQTRNAISVTTQTTTTIVKKYASSAKRCPDNGDYGEEILLLVIQLKKAVSDSGDYTPCNNDKKSVS